MFGNCATGKLRTVSEPTSTRTTEMTIATIGRLMKNFDMTLPAHRFHGEWFRIYLDAAAHFLNSFGNDTVPRIESACDYPTPINLGSHGHWPDRYLVGSVEDCHLITALEFRNRTLGNQQGSLFCPDYCTNLGVTAGFQNIVGVGKKPGEPDRARGLINLSVGKIESPLVWVG